MRRTTTVLVILFVLSVAMCNRILRESNVRTVEFVSVLACGLLAGALLAIVILNRRDNTD